MNVKIRGGRVCFGIGQTSDISVMTQKVTPTFLLYLLLVLKTPEVSLKTLKFIICHW